MTTPYHAIAALLGSVTFLVPGNALLNTLVPLRAKLEAFPSVTLGLLGSVYFGAMLVGALASPAIIKRLGYARGFAVFAGTGAAAALSYPIQVEPGWWLLLRAVLGFCIAGLFSISDGWVQGKADNTNRGSLGAAYQFVHFVASSVGQALIVLADPGTPWLFLLGAALFLASAAPLGLARTPPPARPRSARPEFGWLMRKAPVAAVAAITVGCANGSFWSLAPVFGVSEGLSTGQIAAFLTATVVGSAAAVWPLGRLSDRMDRRIVMAAQMVAALVFELALWRVGASLGWGTAVFGFLIGAVTMTIYSVAISHANDRTEAARSVAIASGLLFFYCAGAVGGPLAAVVAMERLGPSALFLFMAGAHALALAFTLARIALRPAAKTQVGADATLPP
jgi:MFS family permease